MLRAFQWDLARQVERLDHLLDLLPRYAEWGYQRLYLHLEDAVDYPSLPGVARADAYSWPEFQTLVSTAQRHGIQVVPVANLLGHTQYLVKTPEWRDLNELRDPATGAPLPVGQICPLHPRIPELVEKLFRDLSPLCTAGEIHAGLDESFHLGKHPLSRAEVAEIGLAAHFARHVARLHAAAARHGLRLGLWADMLALLPEAAPLLPPGLSLYDWYYHPFGRQPRVELYNFSEYDLPAILARSSPAQPSSDTIAHHPSPIAHSHWACPMNGAFRHESAPVWTDRLQNLAAWWRRAHATGAAGYLVTSWEPYRLSLPTTTLMDAAAATLWLDPDSPDDPATLLAAGLRRYTAGADAGRISNFKSQISNPAARSTAARLLATDSLAFCGNSRWEINNGWAPVAGRRDTPAPHARAARRLARLAASPALADRHSPLAPLAATLRFQAYLARREAFVRTAASLTHRLRRAVSAAPSSKHQSPIINHTFRESCLDFAAHLRAARADARAMWIASRPASTFATSQNAKLLAADAARLRALRAWLRAVARRPLHAFRASPVAGRWTLRFTVHHFAPCHQKLVVEQQQPDGAWRELHARVLIEFRAAAARPQTPRLRFEFAVPVERPDSPLRIASRCLGEFAVSHVELTDGVVTLRHTPFRTRHVLGPPAPAAGWPRIDWQTNTATLPLAFAPAPRN
jgi:hypothetical protein